MKQTKKTKKEKNELMNAKFHGIEIVGNTKVK